MPQEGVTKFRCDFAKSPALPLGVLSELIRWRQVFYEKGVIGQDAGRYDGAGFGNVSMRLPPFSSAPGKRAFAISGTQTGRIKTLAAGNFSVVEQCFPSRNLVVASGPARPSSESMTHGAVYDAFDAARFVFHVHSPEIWKSSGKLEIPETSVKVAYGTPEMASEISRLARETGAGRKRIISMGGHEDGILSFGATADDAGNALLEHLEKSRS